MEEHALSQEVVTRFLVGSAGKVENSKLLYHFRNELCQSDPQLKKEARELFKSFINQVAVVREEDGVKYVVLKRKMKHLVAVGVGGVGGGGGGPGQEVPKALGKGESLGDLVEEGLQEDQGSRRNSAPSAFTPSEEGRPPPAPQPDPPAPQPGGDPQPQRGSPGHPSWGQSPTTENLPWGSTDPARTSEKVAEGLETTGGQGVSCLDLVPLDTSPPSPPPPHSPPHPPREEANPSPADPKAEANPDPAPSLEGQGAAASALQPKPYTYPLRLPPDPQGCAGPHSGQKGEAVESQGKLPCAGAPGSQACPKTKRCQAAEGGSSSPYLKRVSRVLKVPEDARLSDQVPLEPAEHEWMVRTALGHWTQVTGLLMKDSYLAEKKDFMSGFTAVHWAAKFGNIDMMCWIIDSTERSGVKVDVNCKSHGGYTPLHIAAIHSRDNVIVELVGKYGAKTTLRDYSGKRPHHYLAKESSFTVRQLLGDPEASCTGEPIPQKRGSRVGSAVPSGGNNNLMADDGPFPDPPKPLKKPANLSKFFTTPTGHKKRAKTRPNFASLNEEPEEEREEVVVKRRPMTEIFF